MVRRSVTGSGSLVSFALHKEEAALERVKTNLKRLLRDYADKNPDLDLLFSRRTDSFSDERKPN